MGGVGGKGKGVCAGSVCTGGNVDVVGGAGGWCGVVVGGPRAECGYAAVRRAGKSGSLRKREFSLFFPLYVTGMNRTGILEFSLFSFGSMG